MDKKAEGQYVKFIGVDPPFMPGDRTRIADPDLVNKKLRGGRIVLLNDDGTVIEDPPETDQVEPGSILEAKVPVIRGVIAEMEVTPPAVLGIQSAEKPPRYVAISKVRQAMKTATIEEQPAPALDASGGPTVSKMFQPQVGERAEMIEGDIDQIAVKLVELFGDLGVI